MSSLGNFVLIGCHIIYYDLRAACIWCHQYELPEMLNEAKCLRPRPRPRPRPEPRGRGRGRGHNLEAESKVKVKKAEQNTIFHNKNICHKNTAIINAIISLIIIVNAFWKGSSNIYSEVHISSSLGLIVYITFFKNQAFEHIIWYVCSVWRHDKSTLRQDSLYCSRTGWHTEQMLK